ncbi:MAG: photosynthetic reaction center cytochrome c subunit [Acidobacteria bacterium]|nr:photosynthetic reaction center cytochrome c subunit [Acidobacteriota bacterium]
MKVGSRRVCWGVAGTATAWLLATVLVSGQAAPSQTQPLLAEQVFKNVTAMRGITVDEFMSTMGVFSASLGFSCEDCHTGGSNNWELYAKDISPRKQTARRMVAMMAEINKQYFGGRQVVTCFSCHRGGNRPKVTPSLVMLYGAPPADELDILLPPAPPGTPTAAQILDKYVQALGGADRAARLTSFVARGSYSGYGPEGFPRPVEIFAKAPNQKTVAVRDKTSGDNITTFNGQAAWQSAPFKPVDVLEFHGAELDSLRADAELAFPSAVTQALTNMRSSTDFINDRAVLSVQGAKGNAIVTMYFDEQTGLLTRLVRSTPSVVGRLPVQIDYADYRDVAGLKMPFKWTMSWLDGRSNFELSEIQPNAAVDAARFAKPGPPKPY